jgi:rod shape-determining protein MreC
MVMRVQLKAARRDAPWGVKATFPVLFFVMLSLFLLFADARSLVLATSLRGTLETVTTPLLRVVSAPFDWTAERVNRATSLFTTYQENQRLRQEVSSLTQWKHTSEQLRRENNDLRQYSRFLPDGASSFVTAAVAGLSSTPFGKTMMVRTTEEDAAKPGMVALSSGVVVGRVVRSQPGKAVILLASDPNSRIPVRIRAASSAMLPVPQALGTAVGTGAPLLKLAHQRGTTPLLAGGWVETSGVGGIFPAGLPLGRLVKKGDAWWVEPAVAAAHIRFVTLATYSLSTAP